MIEFKEMFGTRLKTMITIGTINVAITRKMVKERV